MCQLAKPANKLMASVLGLIKPSWIGVGAPRTHLVVSKVGLGISVLFRNSEIQTGLVTAELGTERKFKNFLVSISLTSPTRPISFSKLMTHAVFHIITHHYYYFKDRCVAFKR